MSPGRELTLALFDALTIQDNERSEPIPAEYEQYYPESLQHCNKGGLHLVSLPFVPWALALQKIIANCYKRENILVNRREYIAVSLDKVRKNKDLFESFKKIVQRHDISVSKALLKKIHLRAAEYACRAYTKRRNNGEFNGMKQLASDNTNLAFRTQVQTGCKGATDGANNKSEIGRAHV